MARRVETLQSQQVQLGIRVVSDLMDDLGNDREKRLQESDRTTRTWAAPALRVHRMISATNKAKKGGGVSEDLLRRT